jgi:hypothetical protein
MRTNENGTEELVSTRLRAEYENEVTMFRWIHEFKEATTATKSFCITNFIFMFMLITTAIYCYVKLDESRSLKSETLHSKDLPFKN